jgi:hypothetical protein
VRSSRNVTVVGVSSGNRSVDVVGGDDAAAHGDQLDFGPWSGPTTPTPIAARRCRWRWPTSATLTLKRLLISATIGLTVDRFCLSECTSPRR